MNSPKFWGCLLTASWLFTIIGLVGTIRPLYDDYVPTCEGKRMAPSDVCVISTTNGRGGGRKTYDQMIAEHREGRRTSQIAAYAMLGVGSPLALLSTAVLVVALVRARKLTRDWRFDDDAVVELAEARGWKLSPFETRLDDYGAPLGTLHGELNGLSFRVDCYEEATHFNVPVPIKGIAGVTVHLNSGRLMVAHRAFRELLERARIEEVARDLGIADFLLYRGSLTWKRPGRLSAAELDDGLHALTTLVSAFPGVAVAR